jgi:hypothetical protein
MSGGREWLIPASKRTRIVPLRETPPGEYLKNGRPKPNSRPEDD